MFADLAQCAGCDSLEGGLRFLDAEDEQRDCPDLYDGHGQLWGVLGDVGEGPGCGLLDGGVEFFQAYDECFEGA